MKIEPFGALQMTRTHEAHTGRTTITDIAGAPQNKIPSAADNAAEKTRANFRDYLTDAFSQMNSHQTNVELVQKQLITDPDSVDIHDVTIAMAKARMSLDLAKSVIDRVVSGWNEISTTR